MEHKGIQFSVVQTANPTGFRWSVQLDATRTRSGVSYSMKAAILDAQRKIDKELGSPKRSKAASVGYSEWSLFDFCNGPFGSAIVPP